MKKSLVVICLLSALAALIALPSRGFGQTRTNASTTALAPPPTMGSASLYAKYLGASDIEKVSGLQVRRSEQNLALLFITPDGHKVLEAGFQSASVWKEYQDQKANQAITGLDFPAVYSGTPASPRLVFVKRDYCVSLTTWPKADGQSAYLAKDQLIELAKIIAGRM